MILFSILVHEKPDVVINQLINFKAYNPESKIVLHISANMPAEDYKLLMQKLEVGFSYVYCNPIRLYSGYADGTQFKMHVENIRFALKENINFSHLCLHASNDMFVQSGLLDYIKEFDAGFGTIEGEAKLASWGQYQMAKLDRRFQKRISQLNYKIIGCQVEGTFYSKVVLEQVIDELYSFKYEITPKIYAHGYSKWTNFLNRNLRIRSYLSRLTKSTFYGKEELFFTTFSQGFIKKQIYWMYCFINWDNNLVITKQDIESIRNGNFKALYGQADVNSTIKYFAVKRVERNMDDEIRKFITSSQPNLLG